MLDKLLSFGPLSGVRNWLQTHRPFKSKVTTWYDFLCRIFENLGSNDLSERAAAVSFNLFLAIFPAIIFLFTLIPYIPIQHLDDQIMLLLSRVIPQGTFESVETTIRDIINRQRSGVLSFGFLLTLYAATNGMSALMNAFNSSKDIKERRGFLKTRLTALGLTFTFAVAIVLAIVLLLVGDIITDHLLRLAILNNSITVTFLNFTRYLLVFTVFVCVVSVIYHFGPNVRMRWSFINPGVVTASVLIVLTTYLFSFYLANFGSYNKVYGSIGTLIALMVWLNLIALLIILGFEINVALYTPTKKPHETTNATSNK